MSVKTSADWFEYALAGNASSIRTAKKKWNGTKDADGNTALMLVSKLEDNSVFDLLIYEEAGNMNNDGHSALSIAVLSRQMDKIERLATLEGSMVLARGCTALIYAASVQDADVVPLLAPYSLLDQRNDEGYSALDIAVMNNDVAFVTSLLNAVQVDLDTLDMAIRYSLTPDSVEINQILMDYRDSTYPNSDPFDPDAKPTSYQAPSTTSAAISYRETVDPRSGEFAPSNEPSQSRSEKQKGGRLSRSSSKQQSIRKTPKIGNASFSKSNASFSKNNASFSKNQTFSNSALVQSVVRVGTPEPEETSSRSYGRIASERSFEPNASLADQTNSRLTNTSVRPQDAVDPGYATSYFGDAVRSTSLVDDPSRSNMDLRSQRSGNLSHSGSKQDSVRRSPEVGNASFSNSAYARNSARSPEEVTSMYRMASGRSMDLNASPADQTASRLTNSKLTNASVRQDTIDPGYANSVRSASFADEQFGSNADLASQRSGKLSRSSSKQQSIRKTPQVDNLSFSRNQTFSNSMLTQSIARQGTPEPEDPSSMYSNQMARRRSFEPNVSPTDQTASRLTNASVRQDTIDPEYANSVRSTSFAEDPSLSNMDSKPQKSGRLSRASSKQQSVRKTPKIGNASFSKNQALSNSMLTQSIARQGTPEPDETQSVYSMASGVSFDPNTSPTGRTASRMSEFSARQRDVADPGYPIRSTSFADDPFVSKTDLTSEKGAKLSRASPKQKPNKKAPKYGSASFSNSTLVQSVARIETPAPEDAVPAYGRMINRDSAAYGETYAMSIDAPVDGYVDSELQYSVTPSEILTNVGYARSAQDPASNSAMLSRLYTPTCSTITEDGSRNAVMAASRSLQNAPQPMNTNSVGSFEQTAYSNPALSTRSIAESMPVQSRRALPENASIAQLQELVREKQAIIDDLQDQNTKMNKEVVDLKRSLHKAELAAGSNPQGHWATQSSIDRTNLVITDMQEQAREMKTQAIRAKNFFERERERLNEDINEKTKRIAFLENTNRNLETSCERLRAANKDLIEQLTKKTKDGDVTEMLVAQKDAEIADLRDRISTLENDIARLVQNQRVPSTVGRSHTGDNATVSQLAGDSYLRAQPSNSTRLSAGPDDAGTSEASLQDVVRQLTNMNNSKDIIISELRGELANLRDVNTRIKQSDDVNRSKANDEDVHNIKMALADLQVRHDALSEDNNKTLENLRIRTRELQGLVEEIENEIPAGSMGTSVDLSRMKAIVKIKNREIADLKESALNTATRHAATCKAINAENERLNATIRRKDNELAKARSELSTARDFQNHVEGVRNENTQLQKEMKRMRSEIEKHANAHPELAKYESLIKSLGEENDTMRRVLKKRKEQIEYLKNGGDPSLLNTIGTGSKLASTGISTGDKVQMLEETNPHSDIINRDSNGNDVTLVKKLTEEVGQYDNKVTELSRMIALKDAEISLLRKQTTDGATYKDLLCLLNEKMKRVDQLNADVEQRDREISKLVTINRTGTVKPKGLPASIHKSSAIGRFYSHDEVKDLLKQLSDKEAEIALLKSENINNSYEKIQNMGDKFNVVKIENLEDKVAVLNAHLADRDGTIERLQAQLQDAELALQSHRANLGLIGPGGLVASGSYASNRASSSPGLTMASDLDYSKSLEASNAVLQQKLADSKLRVADAQQELDWAQMRMNSMNEDLQKYKNMSNAENTPTVVTQKHSSGTPLSATGQRPVLEPRNHTPMYGRGK